MFIQSAEAVRRIIDESHEDYGDRSGGVEDPSGTQWWIATHLG